MSKGLFNKVSRVDQDNLIAGLYPRAQTTAVKIAANAGILTRGTILSVNGDGYCEGMKAGSTPAYILQADVDASGSVPVTAVAYRSGKFNINAVTVADGYTLSAADKNILRTYNIIFTDMFEE